MRNPILPAFLGPCSGGKDLVTCKKSQGVHDGPGEDMGWPSPVWGVQGSLKMPYLRMDEQSWIGRGGREGDSAGEDRGTAAIE